MKENPILDWLLEEDNPPVRLLTLTRLLRRPETDAEVQDARAQLMDYPVTQAILAHSDEFWQDDKRAYWKYRGKYWQVIFLGQFLADGRDPRIAGGVRDLLAAPRVGQQGRAGQCLTANMLAAFRRLGYGDASRRDRRRPRPWRSASWPIGASTVADDLQPALALLHGPAQAAALLWRGAARANGPRRCRSAIDWIVQELIASQVYVYVPGNRKAWQKVLAQAPKARRPAAGRDGQGLDRRAQARFLAEHGLGERDPKPGWTRFGFPLNYNSDILEAMVALATVWRADERRPWKSPCRSSATSAPPTGCGASKSRSTARCGRTSRSRASRASGSPFLR